MNDSLRHDVADALRNMRKSPAFTAVAVLSLALGIGANAAMSSLWNGVLRASLPGVANPEELVILSDPGASGLWNGRWETREDGPRAWLTFGEFERIRDRTTTLSAVMATQSSLQTFQVRVDGGQWESARGRLVSGEFFQTLGVRPAAGRMFDAADDRAAAPYAVISHRYWQQRFGGRADVVGRTVTVRSTPVTIVGVAPRGLVGETAAQIPDFWLPVRLQPRVLPGSDRLRDTPPQKAMWLHVFGRMKPGVSLAQVDAEANAILQADLLSFYGAAASDPRQPELLDQHIAVRPAARGASPHRDDLSDPLWALLAAVGVLLLIGCANLANFLLARGAARKREIAVRVSLGATRSRLVRQFVTETVVLAAFGGVAALAVAALVHGGLVRMLAASDPRFDIAFAVDLHVLAFVVGVTVVSALSIGLLPAWQASTITPGQLLGDSRSTAGSTPMRSGRLLVAAQLALSLPLLAGAGLLVRTVHNLQALDLGFDAERVLLLRVDVREAAADAAGGEALLGNLRAALQRIPGVESVSYSNLGIFEGGNSMTEVRIEGRGPLDRNVAYDVVGPGYFSTLGVPVLHGGEATDRDGTREGCVVNEVFARRFLDGRNPVGLTLILDADGNHVCPVLGMAGNARTQDLRDDVEPRFYVRSGAYSINSPTFMLRTTVDPATLTGAVRATLQQVNPALPVLTVATVTEHVAPLVAQDRATAQLAVVFGGLALALAAIGLYGVLSYGIARRKPELAVRIALGAQWHRVVSMIVAETTWVLAAGLIAGGALTYTASRLLVSRLYGVEPGDPLTLAIATIVLVLVALVATVLPAARASRVDPIAALRG
jgi:predicted permease